MRILIGFDESEGGWDAVALARLLATVRDSSLLLVDVLPGEEPIPVTYHLLPAAPVRDPGSTFDDALTALAGAEVETRAFSGGSPAQVLGDLVASEGIDLVVLGSPHRGAVGRTFLGSVAERLLHRAAVPLAIAPRGYRERGAASLELIAVAYDGTPEARHALAEAQSLARATGAGLRLLTVVSPAVPMPGVSAYTPLVGPEIEELLAEALATLDPGVQAEGRRLVGPQAASLAEACEDGVDLLVTGTRGLGPLGRTLSGSVGSSLICRAPCPVLVAPGTGAGEESLVTSERSRRRG